MGFYPFTALTEVVKNEQVLVLESISEEENMKRRGFHFKQRLYWYGHQRKLQAARMGMWNWRCLPHPSRHPGHRIT